MISSKRICFTDFDGVLNDPKYLMSVNRRTSISDLDPHRIALLSNLCHRTKAKVVLTSSWRDDLKVRKYLKRCGVPIIGVTPHGRDRGQEIHQWILDKKFNGSYVILDDECAELNETQKKRLIYTREGNNLGLTFKHTLFAEMLFKQGTPEIWADDDFIRAILLAIKEDLDRVWWNVYQKDYDDTPFQNTGNVEGFKTDIFEVHAYDWGWDYDDRDTPRPVNFKWKDLEINWYKWYGRGISTNRAVTHDELAQMLTECLESLDKWEQEHEE